MERVFDFKVTRRELAEIMEAASKTWEKGVEPEALAVVTKVKDKAVALLAYMDAKDGERMALRAAARAKRARLRAQAVYDKAVEDIPDKAEADNIERDGDGIPVLPFE